DSTSKLVSPIVSSFPPVSAILCRPTQVQQQDWPMSHRQQLIPWWNQEQIQHSSILLVGAGGLGSNQAKILVQMGVGSLDVVDYDVVEDSNRNRQLFTERDVGKPKPHQVLNNVAPYAVYATALRGYYMTFYQWAKDYRRQRHSVICCGVDNFHSI